MLVVAVSNEWKIKKKKKKKFNQTFDDDTVYRIHFGILGF